MKFQRDPEFLKKRAEAYKDRKNNPSSGSGNRDFLFKEQVPYFGPKQGENVVRLLPSMYEGAWYPWMEAFVHYQIGPNNSQYFCLTRMLNKPCPICEEAKKAADRGDDPKLIQPLYPARRGLVWLIDRSEPAKGPLSWAMPYKNMVTPIFSISFSRKTGEPVFVDDPKEGRDIIFNVEGKLRNTTYYGVQKEDEPSLLHEDEATVAKWLAFVEEKSYPNLIQYKTYERIKAVLYGEDETPEVPITSSATKTEERKFKEPKPESKPEPETLNGNGTIPVGEGLSLAKLREMGIEALVELIDSRNLGVDPADWEDVNDLRGAISLELDLTN